MNESQIKPNNYFLSAYYRKTALTPEKKNGTDLQYSPIMKKPKKKNDSFGAFFGCMGTNSVPTDDFESTGNNNHYEKVKKQAIENISNLPSEINSSFDNISVSRREVYTDKKNNDNSFISVSIDKKLEALQNMTMKDVAVTNSGALKKNFEKLLSNFENEMVKQDNSSSINIITNDQFQNKDNLILDELKTKISTIDDNFFESEQKRSSAITHFKDYSKFLDDIQNKDDQQTNENMYRIAEFIDQDTDNIIKIGKKNTEFKRKRIDELNKENREIHQWVKEIKDFEFQNDYAMKQNYEKYGRERMKDLAYELVINRLGEHEGSKFKTLQQKFMDKHKIYKKYKTECQEKTLRSDAKLIRQEIMNLETEINKVQGQIRHLST